MPVVPARWNSHLPAAYQPVKSGELFSPRKASVRNNYDRCRLRTSWPLTALLWLLPSLLLSASSRDCRVPTIPLTNLFGVRGQRRCAQFTHTHSTARLCSVLARLCDVYCHGDISRDCLGKIQDPLSMGLPILPTWSANVASRGVVPNLLAPGTSFVEGSFSTDWGWRGLRG